MNLKIQGCENPFNPLQELPAELAREIRNKSISLGKISNVRGIFSIAIYWMVAAIALLVAYVFNYHWLSVFITLIILAKAQYSLLLVAHDAGHRTLFSNWRWNDLTASFFVSGPVGVGFYRSRRAHLDHHKFLYTNNDQEIDYYDIKNLTKYGLIVHLLSPLFGAYVWRKILIYFGRGLRRYQPTFKLTKDQLQMDKVSILMAQLFLLGGAALIDWRLYLLWVGAIVTTTACGHTIKAFCDHAHIPGSLYFLYSYRPTLIDRMLLGTMQSCHAEHHLFPNIPHYNLDKISSAVQKLPGIGLRGGYFNFILEYFRKLKKI
uniref:fatty acid desaturase family protein n=1 Tax=Polynucleobacter sp. TaxID=2029855 RepID=UPI004047CCCB